MMIYKPGKESTIPPTPEHMATMGQYIDKLTRAGVLVATDGLQHSSKGARVRIADGRIAVTDGPFAEAKEVIGGYAIVLAKSKDEAIEHAKDFLSLVGEGESEVRQMHDPTDFAPQ
jgi:hypothetical protein